MRILKKALNTALRSGGYELRRIRSPINFLEDSAACPRALYCRGVESFLVTVPLTKIKDSRLIRAWSTALKQYPDGGRVAVRHELERYFDDVQPPDVAGVLKLPPNRSWHRGHPLSWVMPWQTKKPEAARKARIATMTAECRRFGFSDYSEADGWKGFGPVSNALLNVETERLIQLYNSLEKNGFQSSHGFTTGRLYLAGRQYLVSPDAGWHRIAAMIALGHNALPLRFVQSASSVVRREDVAFWPGVQCELFSEDEALAIFDQLFVPYQ